MPDLEDVEGYFSRAAMAFDSLYCEGKVNPLVRFVNRTFRRDIYLRFALTMEHVRKYQLESALDVGCGSGRYVYALAGLGLKRIVGVDISQKMIDLALRNNSPPEQATETSLELVRSGFMEFQTQETFDIVIAMGLFDYIKEPFSVLRRMRDLANHSVVASFPSVSMYRTPIRKVRYHFKRCPVYFFRENAITTLSLQVGFSDVEVVKIKGSGMDYFVTFFK